MANNRFQVKRTSTAGRTPNTTNAGNLQYIAAGEFALNMTDQLMFTSDGTNLLYVGANQVNQRITNSLTLDNDKNIYFKTVNTSAAVGFRQQNDDNFVFYSTNSTYGQRAVFAIYANSDTSNLNIIAPLNVSNRIGANNTYGTAGQVLTSGGSGANAYWTTAGAASVNVDAQYTWTNTHTFQNTITFSSNVAVGANVIVNTTTMFIGNTTANSTRTSILVQVANSTTTANLTPADLKIGATTVVNSTQVTATLHVGNVSGSYANITGQVNTATLYAATSANIASAVQANATGVYTTGTVNAASHTVGTSTVANSLGVYTGVVNAATHSVGTAFTANATVVNAVSYYSGTLLVANSTVVNATHLGGIAAASYVQNTDSRTLSGNLYFTGANTTISANLAVVNSTANIAFFHSNGHVLIGATTPEPGVAGGAGGKLQIHGSGFDTVSVYANSDSLAPSLRQHRKRVTGGTVQVSDVTGIQQFAGWSGTNYRLTGRIVSAVDSGTISDTSMPGYVSIETTPDASNNPVERIRITQSGNVGISNTAPDAKLAVTGTANVSANVRIGGVTTLVANVVLGTTTITANGSVGTAKQALVSGATSNVSWATLDMTYIPDAVFKKSVTAATTADLAAASATSTTITGTLVVLPAQDGITLVVGDRLLVKDQATPAQNGIYEVTVVGVAATTAWVLTRTTDADTISELAGAFVSVDSGTVNGGRVYDNDLKTTDTLGTTAVTWSRNVDDAGATFLGNVVMSGAATGIFPTSNTSGFTFGNTIARWVIVANSGNFSTTLAAGNTTVTGFVNATSSVNAASLTVGTSTIANTLGVYTGIVNAATHSVGTAFTANATVVNAVSYYSGTLLVANSTVVNATHLGGYTWSAPAALGGGTANTGAFTTLTTSSTALLGGYTQIAGSASQVGIKFTGAGTQYGLGMQPASDGTTMVTFFNAAGSSVGTITQTASTLVYNGTGASLSYANVSGQVNTATLFATTSANVGANVQLTTSTLLIGNSTVNSNHTASLLQVANSTTIANVTAAGIQAYTNSTVNSTVTASLVQVSNSTATSNLTAQGLLVGANVVANTTALRVGNTTITTTNAIFGGTIAANGGIGTAGHVLTSGAAGNAYWAAVSATIDVNATYSWTNVHSFSNVVYLATTAASNVGIGTNTPAYKLQVNGSFAAVTKSFVIDHPTKQDMKLRYGSLEGPENGVYVRGRANTNKIELPDYWINLVDENSITVSLTAIGKKQDLYVKSIVNNVITVAGSRSLHYFYVVFAERKDVDKLVVEF